MLGTEISIGEKEAGQVVPAAHAGALPFYLMNQVVSKKDRKSCLLTFNHPMTSGGGLSQQLRSATVLHRLG